MEQVLNEKQQMLIQHGGFLIKYAQAKFLYNVFIERTEDLESRNLGLHVIATCIICGTSSNLLKPTCSNLQKEDNYHQCGNLIKSTLKKKTIIKI